MMTRGGPLIVDAVGLVRHLQPVRLRQLRVRRRGELRAVRRSSWRCRVLQFRLLGSSGLTHDHSCTSGPRGGTPAGPLVLYVVLIAGLLVVVGPFLWMLLSSIKPEARDPARAADLVAGDVHARPTTTTCSPGWTSRRYFANSLIVAVLVTAGNLLFCSALGYALAKLRFPGKQGAVRPRAGHADGARHGDLRAAVRPGQQPRPGQHATPAWSCRSWPVRSACS